ncbi:hypothetical protein BBJ28_00019439 [Nothophytophthora sp. Chile5]|nr:hypothetical protein BBJ28_00019439 [Nothophytophthora sp. Chile5]
MARKGTQVAPPALRRSIPRRAAQATATGAKTLQVLQPVAPAKSGVKKRKLEAMSRDDDKSDKNCLSKPSKQGKGRVKAPVETAKDVAVEGDELTRFEPETTRFCELLELDARRLPPPPPPLPKRRGVSKSLLKTPAAYFELPFKAAEIKSLAERKSERRPPPYGKISRCVYVSTTMPVADLPVHKCACFEETCKVTTKRATQLASAKARREHLQDGSSATEHPLTRHADQQRQEELENTVYCGEGCHNRMLFISCSDDSCSAPDPRLCSNRAIQRRELKSVRVAYIPGPGFGLMANEKIRSGEFIIEYVGEVIDDEECERRMIKYRDNGEVRHQ